MGLLLLRLDAAPAGGSPCAPAAGRKGLLIPPQAGSRAVRRLSAPDLPRRGLPRRAAPSAAASPLSTRQGRCLGRVNELGTETGIAPPDGKQLPSGCNA